MATIRDIQDSIREWVALALPAREFQFENEELPTPTTPWVTVYVNSITPLQHDIGDMLDDPLTPGDSFERQRGLSTINIKVSVWDGDALNDAKRLRVSTSASFAIYTLYSVMGRSSITPLIDLTSDSEGKRMRRAEFTLTGYSDLTEDYTIDYFNELDLNGVTIGVNNPPPSDPGATP